MLFFSLRLFQIINLSMDEFDLGFVFSQILQLLHSILLFTTNCVEWEQLLSLENVFTTGHLVENPLDSHVIISELRRFSYHLVALFFVEFKKTVLKAPIETKKALILQDSAIGLSPLIIRLVHFFLKTSSQLIDLLSKVVEDFRALVL